MSTRRLTEICDGIVGKILEPNGRITTVFLWERVRDIEDELDTLRQQNAALVEAGQAFANYLLSDGRVGTHWEGCEDVHPRCKLLKDWRAALAAAKGGE